ncbi:hypothetical protein Brsp06_04996 [Brucella sp. NBRC 13694]
MPWVVDRFTSMKATRMLCDLHTILPYDDPICIGMNFYRTTNCS